MKPAVRPDPEVTMVSTSLCDAVDFSAGDCAAR